MMTLPFPHSMMHAACGLACIVFCVAAICGGNVHAGAGGGVAPGSSPISPQNWQEKTTMDDKDKILHFDNHFQRTKVATTFPTHRSVNTLAREI